VSRPGSWPVRLAGVAVLACAAAVGAAETWHRQASRSWPGADRRRPDCPQAVVVLGHPSRRNGRLHPIQKWRTEIAVRSMPPSAEGVLVFSGGRTRGAAVSEAETMAAYARELRVPDDRILLETRAASTWQNIKLSLPMIESYDTIVIASDPVHAARGRRYLSRQRPDLAGRLAFADDYRFGERWWLKTPIAAYELAVAVLGRWRFQAVVNGRDGR
jgi:uncharacterized SAM-binding protein YcdF (DUF218 family)